MHLAVDSFGICRPAAGLNREQGAPAWPRKSVDPVGNPTEDRAA
jgi:hypothetical protein